MILFSLRSVLLRAFRSDDKGLRKELWFWSKIRYFATDCNHDIWCQRGLEHRNRLSIQWNQCMSWWRNRFQKCLQYAAINGFSIARSMMDDRNPRFYLVDNLLLCNTDPQTFELPDHWVTLTYPDSAVSLFGSTWSLTQFLVDWNILSVFTHYLDSTIRSGDHCLFVVVIEYCYFAVRTSHHGVCPIGCGQ